MHSLDLPADLKSDDHIIVGMSGGVDSSVAAWLLKQAGFSVSGLFMKNWEEDDGTEYCTAVQDLADAQTVCDTIGIELYQANFAAEYWDNVFSRFLDEYRAGRTPNPDVLCNREIKFNVFARYAELLGADWVATGHYARLDYEGELPRLMKARDTAKDQSYFLQAVTAKQFDHCLFPLGNLNKQQVREIAKLAGLPTFAKKDSTGICFIGERRFADFLEQYVSGAEGPICTLEGEEIGRHQGLMFHTIGQRQGLGIGGIRAADDAPWYVVRKDIPTNTLVVAQGNDHPALMYAALSCDRVEWIDGKGPELPARLSIKTRYRQPDQQAEVTTRDGGVFVCFEQPQRAVTPGQWACFYDGEYCLGGGIITGTVTADGDLG